MLKIFLIGYCNISTITIAQLFKISTDDISLNIMVFCIFIFYILGLPIFIFKLIYSNINKLYQHKFRDTYGVLYLNFKTDTKYSSFIIILLIKQLLYSILINVSYTLTFIQNTFFLLINIIYLCLIFKYRPYVSKLDQLHSHIIIISTVTTTLINYVFLIDLFTKTSKHIFETVNMIIHIGTIITFIILQLIGYYHKQRKITVIKRSIIGGDIEMNIINSIEKRGEENNILLDSNPNYLKTKSQRFTDIIDNNL